MALILLSAGVCWTFDLRRHQECCRASGFFYAVHAEYFLNGYQWLLSYCRFSKHLKHQLPTLHCTVMGFVLDWESHKSLKHDRERLTKLLERAFFQRHAIERIQLAEVDWETDNKGFE